MSQSHSIIKQLHINRISLPYDVISVIKSYCFYEFIVWKTRMQKKEIIKSIQESFTSGIGDEQFNQNDDHDLFLYLTKDKGIQLQIRFCVCCGDYIICSTYEQMDNLIEKIRCSCLIYEDDPPYDYEDDDPYYYDYL